jgi:hypothetical protein
VEILYFDGCPNHESAIAFVERISRELGIEPELRLVNVPSQEAAEQLRFLGSPTIRVDGVDVDPHAEASAEYGLSCRLFQTAEGIAGQPDERWVRESLGRRAAVAALDAAAIPAERRGTARLARLSDSEQALYRWILRTFAAGASPLPDALVGVAASLDLDPEAALAKLAHEDLVHHDPASGTILVAYPFSSLPRGHRVEIDGNRWVEAMCAIDALGIAPMLGSPIEIASRDPRTGTEIRVRLNPGAGAGSWWEPESAVVLAESCCEGPSFRSCCDVLNFFESRDSVEQYLREHREVKGLPISIPDAIEVGGMVFGGIFGEP